MEEGTKRIIIGWAGVLAALAIICGSITMYGIYVPPKATTDALTICAQYTDARASHFCVELARAQARGEPTR